MGCRSGIGTTFSMATTPAFTTKVRTINGVGFEREVLDCTHLGSPASATYANTIIREFMPGDLATWNQMTLGIFWDPDEVGDYPMDGDTVACTIGFRAVRIAGTPQATPASIVFPGFLVSLNGDINFEGLMEGTVVLQPAGDMVFTAGVA